MRGNQVWPPSMLWRAWGKGRPLCEDWGYTSGPGAPASEHNRLDIGGEGQVIAFAAQDGLDYLHSRQGPWDR